MQVNAADPYIHDILKVGPGLGSALGPAGCKALSMPVLIQFPDAICYHQGPMS